MICPSSRRKLRRFPFPVFVSPRHRSGCEEQSAHRIRETKVRVQWAKAPVVGLGGSVRRIGDYLSCPQPAHNQKGRGEVTVGSSLDELPQTKHQMSVALVACLWLLSWIEFSARALLPEDKSSSGHRRNGHLLWSLVVTAIGAEVGGRRWNLLRMPSLTSRCLWWDGNHSGSSVDVD